MYFMAPVQLGMLKKLYEDLGKAVQEDPLTQFTAIVISFTAIKCKVDGG